MISHNENENEMENSFHGYKINRPTISGKILWEF